MVCPIEREGGGCGIRKLRLQARIPSLWLVFWFSSSSIPCGSITLTTRSTRSPRSSALSLAPPSLLLAYPSSVPHILKQFSAWLVLTLFSQVSLFLTLHSIARAIRTQGSSTLSECRRRLLRELQRISILPAGARPFEVRTASCGRALCRPSYLTSG
ncbi:hypothetical protein B0H12DRAFT_701940 [Mycena haematopus]|nr:hypothetical protein B0H12DRAFT_701940 [Mycena haematopus]